MLACLFLLLLLFVKDRNISSAPVHNQSLSDQKQHDGNLSNGKEAPDRSLYHKVIRDHGSQDRTEEKEKNTLDDHSLLLVQGKKRGKHEEGMDASSLHEVGGISHRHRPAKMVHTLSLESAQRISSEPFRGRV